MQKSQTVLRRARGKDIGIWRISLLHNSSRLWKGNAHMAKATTIERRSDRKPVFYQKSVKNASTAVLPVLPHRAVSSSRKAN
jgi:hypothetical protein